MDYHLNSFSAKQKQTIYNLPSLNSYFAKITYQSKKESLRIRVPWSRTIVIFAENFLWLNGSEFVQIVFIYIKFHTVMEDVLKQRIMSFCTYLKEQGLPLNIESVLDKDGTD